MPSIPQAIRRLTAFLHALEEGGSDVTVISPLLLKRGTMKWFSRDTYPIGKQSEVVYPGNVDMKGVSLLVTLFTVFFSSYAGIGNIRRSRVRLCSTTTAWNRAASHSIQMLFRVPLVIEYEDGIYAVTERTVITKKSQLPWRSSLIACSMVRYS